MPEDRAYVCSRLQRLFSPIRNQSPSSSPACSTPASSGPPVDDSQPGPTTSRCAWTGGDVDLSIPLTDRKVLFIYGDTLIGGWDVNDSGDANQRLRNPSAGFPHSSVGIWDADTNKMAYHWGTDGSSFFRPPWEEEHRYFWATAATPLLADEDVLFVFGPEIRTKKSGDPFGFTVESTWCVRVEGPRSCPADPSSWRMTFYEMPRHHRAAPAEAEAETTSPVLDYFWYSAVFFDAASEMVYLYGSSSAPEDLRSAGVVDVPEFSNDALTELTAHHHKTRQTLCRIPVSALLAGITLGPSWHQASVWCRPPRGHPNGNTTRRGGGGEIWVPFDEWLGGPPTTAASVWAPAVSEFSVCVNPASSGSAHRLLLLFNQALGTNIFARTAAAPEGPWPANEPSPVLRIPPPFNDVDKFFCYAVRVHPCLSYLLAAGEEAETSETTGPGLVFTFTSNAHHAHLLFDPGCATVYTPVFCVWRLSSI